MHKAAVRDIKFLLPDSEKHLICYTKIARNKKICLIVSVSGASIQKFNYIICIRVG